MISASESERNAETIHRHPQRGDGCPAGEIAPDASRSRWPRYYLIDLLAITLGFALSLTAWKGYDGILLGMAIAKSGLTLVILAAVLTYWSWRRGRSKNPRLTSSPWQRFLHLLVLFLVATGTQILHHHFFGTPRYHRAQAVARGMSRETVHRLLGARQAVVKGDLLVEDHDCGASVFTITYDRKTESVINIRHSLGVTLPGFQKGMKLPADKALSPGETGK